MSLATLVPRANALPRSIGAARGFNSRMKPAGVSPRCPAIASNAVPRTPFSTTRHTSNKNQPNTCADAFTTALARNKDWAARTARETPSLFPALSKGQKPQILWIGCSDSRCPETTLLDQQPGDVFVHRNIANVLHAGDLSSSAVIEYAVRHLRVAHVVLCGHTSCGGVAAALGNAPLGILDPWLLPLREIRERKSEALAGLSGEEAGLKMVEWNVEEGVKALKRRSVVIEAMQERGLQ
ncbi:carbonic anhydrase, partial [Aspergillus sp. HF37]